MKCFNVYEIFDKYGNSTGQWEKVPISSGQPPPLRDQQSWTPNTGDDKPVSIVRPPDPLPASPHRRHGAPAARGSCYAYNATVMAQAEAAAAARQPMGEAEWRQVFGASRVNSGRPAPEINSEPVQSMWAQAFGAPATHVPTAEPGVAKSAVPHMRHGQNPPTSNQSSGAWSWEAAFAATRTADDEAAELDPTPRHTASWAAAFANAKHREANQDYPHE